MHAAFFYILPGFAFTSHCRGFSSHTPTYLASFGFAGHPRSPAISSRFATMNLRTIWVDILGAATLVFRSDEGFALVRWAVFWRINCIELRLLTGICIDGSLSSPNGAVTCAIVALFCALLTPELDKHRPFRGPSSSKNKIDCQCPEPISHPR